MFESIAGGKGGSDRFVTEAEASRAAERRLPGSEVGDPSKPLVQVLRETAAAKEAAREERERELRIGKNRPLDAEELAFFQAVEEETKAKERAQKREEEDAMAAFRDAKRRGAGVGADAGTRDDGTSKSSGKGAQAEGDRAPAAGPAPPLLPPSDAEPVVPRIKGVFGAAGGLGRLRRARPKRERAGGSEEARDGATKRERAGGSEERGRESGAVGGSVGEAEQRESGGKTAEREDRNGESGAAGGLQSLLGGYGSSSDDSD